MVPDEITSATEFYAVKCNLTELTTRSTSLIHMARSLLYMLVRQDSSCSWSIGHCSVWMAFKSVLSSISVSPERGDTLEAVSGLFFWFSP